MKEEMTKHNGPALSLDSLAEVCRHMAVAIGSEYGSTDKYFFGEGFPELDWHNRVILNEIKKVARLPRRHRNLILPLLPPLVYMIR